MENWCGRLGALMAHWLVYRTVGISAVLFTVWLAAIGLNGINNNSSIPTRKGLRWMAVGFLFLAPLLSFVFPDSTFPLGGALGTGLVDWTNGFLGKAGNVFVMLAVGLFFAFFVFRLDLMPLARSARTLLAGLKRERPQAPEARSFMDEDTLEGVVLVKKAEPMGLKEDADESYSYLQDMPLPAKAPEGNRLKSETQSVPDLQMDVSFRNEEAHAPSVKQREGIHLELPQEEEPLDEAELAQALNMELVYEEAPAPVDGEVHEEMPDNGEDWDFEVKTVVEQPAVPAHGARITVESGEPYDPSLDLPHYKFPTLDLLEDIEQGAIALDREELEKNKNQIISTLRSFGIEIQRISATVGPTVTLYEIVPSEGVRISKIRNLEDDIALNLAALGIRIIAPIPGKGTIGIEVPNTNKQIVPMRTLLSSEKFVNSKMSLPIALGKKIDNENYIVDLATMPHLLMAGATGQGKSVGINAILISLLYKKHPSQLKFVMVDPKKVELSIYRLIEKHYLAMLPNEEEPIITDTKKVVHTVNALCIEMDNRYELLKDAGARNIKEYNEKFIKRRLNPNNGHKYLPFIVLVIDEFADLIMTAGKEVEMPIARLAQLARAVGIHIIIATQRPSVNVITGIIKANFPGRIAFKVSAKVDSRTILDAGGADQLIGRGDMLVSHGSELLRLQCAFVDTPEVERIVSFIGEQKGYATAFELPEYEGAEEERLERESIDLAKRDKMFDECARLVVNSQSGSTSMLQRKFNLGYNRAGRIMDQLEAAGIVGPASGSKPRDVLITTEYELERHLEELF